MPGLWERLAGGKQGRLETSDCESLGSASGSEGGECGPFKGWRIDGCGFLGGGVVVLCQTPKALWVGVSRSHRRTPGTPLNPYHRCFGVLRPPALTLLCSLRRC